MARIRSILQSLDFERLCKSAELKTRFDLAATDSERWNAIRAIYALELPRILEARARGARTDPYFIDWGAYLSPIEFNAWADIRYIGLPFYPQVPVGRRFVDFGDPYLKIAVELDGKQYHEIEQDRLRDQELWRRGWRTFRITGRESYRLRTLDPLTAEWFEKWREDDSEEAANAEVERWQLTCSEGVFDALQQVYYGRRRDRFLGSPLAALRAHRLIEFPVA